MNDISDVITHHIKKILRTQTTDYGFFKENVEFMKRSPLFVNILSECDKLRKENEYLRQKLEGDKSEHIQLEIIEHLKGSSTNSRDRSLNIDYNNEIHTDEMVSENKVDIIVTKEEDGYGTSYDTDDEDQDNVVDSGYYTQHLVEFSQKIQRMMD